MIRTINRRAAVWSAALACALPGFALAEAYTFDAGHTEVMVIWNHLGMSNQSAHFNSVSGDVDLNPADWSKSNISVVIDAASVNSDVPKLDEHLKAEDFFDVAKHPKITFKSTGVKQTGAKSLQIMGNLTAKGKTHPVTLDATVNFIGEHPLGKVIKAYEGVQYIGFSARTRLRRSDFDLGLYAPLTSDTVDIRIETELAKKK